MATTGSRRQVDLATRRYAVWAARYDELISAMGSFDSTLEQYTEATARVSGAARALPGKISMPTVTRSVVRTTVKPRVSATTGASG